METEKLIEIPVLQMFCGIGGGALGFNQVERIFNGIKGRFKNIAGIDCDPECCQDYETITGDKAVVMDLFDRAQYIDFWGKNPPEGWREVQPADLLAACGNVYPEVIFLSPPCKGFSGLLPEKTALTPKYQALNKLVVRSMFLVMETFKDNLPAVILIENVPRITSRGRALLDEVMNLLGSYGYLFDRQTHDCGELGGLGEIRKRFLLIARNRNKVPSYIYQPPKFPHKTIGDILGPLPMPGDTDRCGPMHRIPQLSWRTWERLALIKKGKDWKCLNDLNYTPRGGSWRIVPFDQPCPTITGSMGAGRSNSFSGVADPRLSYNAFSHAFKVMPWDEPCSTITSAHGYCGSMVADPRVDPPRGYGNQFKMSSAEKPSPTITGSRIGSGAVLFADPRLPERANRYAGTYRVVAFDETCPTVTGQSEIQTGAISVADPRLNCNPRSGTMGVMDWDEPCKTITGGDIHSGAAAVADPRIPDPDERGVFIIISMEGTWNRPVTTYEGAIIQGFPRTLPDGRPLVLAGKSDKRWRERIGNAVPPPTATAIADAIMETLLPNLIGYWHWGRTDQTIWVQPSEEADEIVVIN